MIELADRTRFHSKRCGGQTDQSQLGVDHPGVPQELLVHPLAIGRDHVRFVDDHQIELFEVTRFWVDGVNTGCDDGMLGVVSSQTGGIDTIFEFRSNQPDLPCFYSTSCSVMYAI